MTKAQRAAAAAERRKVVAEKLDEIYARIPPVACQRRCQESCGPIVLHLGERARMVDVAGERPHVVGDLSCGYLDAGGCAAYDVRPAICRLWGAVDVEGMRCPFGCLPERWLSDAEAKAILVEIWAIAGRVVVPDLSTAVLTGGHE